MDKTIQLTQNKSETKKFLTEWNDLFEMGYSDAQIEKDSKLLSKMTPQEIEEERSRQVKCHYASLINYELHRLTEEQLFKTFVLIKNTTDELTKPKPVRAPKPSRNRVLFDPAVKMNVDDAGHATKEASTALKNLLVEKNLNEGYGIISMFGQSSGLSYVSISEYICFCIPDKVDLMVEVSPSSHSGRTLYRLSIAVVGEEGRNLVTFYNLDMLAEALNNIVKQYKK